MFGGPRTTTPGQDPEEYTAALRAAMEGTHAAAGSNLQTSVERMKRDYDLRTRSQSLEQGQPIYVLDLGETPRQCKKLCPMWRGPYLIMRKLSPTLFIVADRKRKREESPTLKREQEDPEKAEGGEEIGPVYCHCRQPEDGGFMIACDGCDEWFHGDCVGVTESMAETMGDYHCPTCISLEQ
ncbi:nucleosome-remodeling factor subunit BPTF-like [Haliotis asinina]|uniref:nucleosome-remodeling factor subunit BPTF-like n=1 Tax=Haliotis asinina TaxID=109174 RepID=UPI00353275EE